MKTCKTLRNGNKLKANNKRVVLLCLYLLVVQLITSCSVLRVAPRGNTSESLETEKESRSQKQTVSVDLLRGPYLQLVTPTSIRVKWRTNIKTTSRVNYGREPENLMSKVSNIKLTANHEIKLDHLLPNTKYYYSVGTVKQLLSENILDQYFFTAPDKENKESTRIWVLGDSGRANHHAAAVKNAYLKYSQNNYTHIWLMLGDNAYQTGTDTEYQKAVFDMYPSFLKKTSLWSTLGNHDAYSTDSSTQAGPYYDIFSFPTQGEAGGVASGTESYYSFDYSNIHFISLDSMDSDRSPTGAMMTWLKSDLSQTLRDWIIVFFHHPPYSKGSHDSDNISDSGGRMRDMRKVALPLFDQYGVDLVLSGHSHGYERSFLIKGHYGLSNTLEKRMIVNGGSGQIDNGGAYKKSIKSKFNGVVYTVAGSSGRARNVTQHSTMAIFLETLGSMVIDVQGGRLDAKFLDVTGKVKDYFTIVNN